ncbi:MAG: tetraacyldisaccharide 4'-kinase [Burkholderiaceae bacterium]|nr:tetraacyldisaccharide 4'-kinase [Burkholderiaceae bacterium]
MRLQAEQTLQQAWTQRGLLARLLWPLSKLYELVSLSHRQLYRWGILTTHVLPVPVVVVGNVVAGGGGKTPTVMALVQHLQARGLRPGVVSRGYGRADPACREVRQDSLVSEVGDEPALIFRTCHVPVFVASRRFEAATALLAAHPQTDVIVSDDGLQHHALHHDVAVTVFDDRGLGNGWLLPAGPLRQIWPASPVTTDLVLHTGQQPARLSGSPVAPFTSRRALADYAVRADGSQVRLTDLPVTAGTRLLALAGIAKPEAFFSMLRARGVALAKTLALPDHYNFNSAPGNEYTGYSLICTEKDAIKLWRTHPQALAVPLVFEPETAFFATFDALLDPLLLHTAQNNKPSRHPPRQL